MAVIDQVVNENYAIYNADCVDILSTLKDESIHLSIYSPPFAGLYQYSSNPKDVSNCSSYKQFLNHYEYIISEISRVTIPGRISAVHCMDVPKNGANICGSIDFPGDIIRLHEKHGLEYTPRICIWKEPLRVRNRTMAKALAHKQIVDDSTQTNVASADYLIPFRKKGRNPIPVTHPIGLMNYAGERQVPNDLLRYRGWTGKQTENRYSHWIWRQYASCFWDDIRIDRVMPYKEARDEEDEKHVHPLQLDVIERAVILWSNPDEIVLTPFMGVGSEVYGAVINGRKGIGAELKPTYFNQAVKNVASALEKQQEQMEMFE